MVYFCLALSALPARCQPFGGVVANAVIDLKGNNVTVDSFDSSDPNHSIWQTNMTYHGSYYGIYSNTLSYVSNSFPSRTADATVASAGDIFNVGNANIYGYVDTTPDSIINVADNGAVGDLNWVYSGSFGIEPGHAETNVNQQFYSRSLPSPAANGWQTNWLAVPTPASGTIIKIGGTWTNIAGVWTNVGGRFFTNTGSGFTISMGTGINAVTATYSQVITNRVQNTNYVYYAMNQLTGNLFVDAPNVVLYLTNGWEYSGGPGPQQTFVLNSNADIQIYTEGNVDTTGGHCVIDNGANYARALSIFDVSGFPVSLKFGGSGLGMGYIYAPSSSVNFEDGGIRADVVGCIFCNNFTINGYYLFHFDESLGDILPPWISQSPVNQIIEVGSNATFSVTAGGSSPSYQWYFGTNTSQPATNLLLQGIATNMIPGATNSSLTITNVQLSDAGYYGVVVSNPGGSTAGYLASLTVYSNAAAMLYGSFNPTSEQFQFNVTGVAGLNYVVQCSTNLVDWVPLWTNAAPFSFADTNMDAYPQRFYRSVFVP